MPTSWKHGQHLHMGERRAVLLLNHVHMEQALFNQRQGIEHVLSDRINHFGVERAFLGHKGIAPDLILYSVHITRLQNANDVYFNRLMLISQGKNLMETQYFWISANGYKKDVSFRVILNAESTRNE